MLTPNDIANKKFEKSMNRYKIEEVDSFLNQVAEEMDNLIADKRDLEKKIMVLADKLEEYKQDEESLRAALLGAQKLGGRLQQEPANDGGDNAHHDRGGRQHREQVVRLLFIAGAQCHGDQRAAAGAYHEAQAAKRLQERVDQVQSRKCRFTGKIRDKKAIHHAVHRGEDHHDNGRCHKTQQAAGGKMVR